MVNKPHITHPMCGIYTGSTITWNRCGLDSGLEWNLEWTGMKYQMFSGPLKKQTQHIIIMIGLS